MSDAIQGRYAICPQLAAYDDLLPTLAPYLTFTSPRNHHSAVVNTDADGFRLSRAGSGDIDTTTWPAGRSGGLVLGSSFVFGVGASCDGETLVSHLNARQRLAFLNLGIRAGNSTQELIAAIPFLDRADCIVVCSGINNLLANIQSLGMNELFGPFFGEGAYEPLRDRSLSDVSGLVGRSSGVLGVKRLARERFEQFWSRTSHRRREVEEPASEFETADWEAHMPRALALHRRDLRIINLARRPDSILLFAAQPFAPCCERTLSSEERSLFEINDRWESPGWGVVKTAVTDLWPRWVSALRRMCTEENVPFVDLSACELTGWSFVDRVHMTDAGYRQVAGFLAAEVSSFQCVS